MPAMKWLLLEGLPDDDVRRVLGAARRRTFARGVVLFHEGDPGESLHLISAGRVAVRVTTALGQSATLNILRAGDFIGEMALLGREPRRSATAIALEPVETLSVERAAFDTLRDEHPSVRAIVERILTERVRHTSDQLLEALYVPADTRVLRRLLTLCDIYGDDGADVVVPLGQEDIAGLAGTTRATVNRVLGAEQERGTVALGRGKVTVKDAAAIAKRAR